MKDIIVNGFKWWLDPTTGKFYENEDKTGVSFDYNNPHLTHQERKQINDLLRFDNPMIVH